MCFYPNTFLILEFDLITACDFNRLKFTVRLVTCVFNLAICSNQTQPVDVHLQLMAATVIKLSKPTWLKFSQFYRY